MLQRVEDHERPADRTEMYTHPQGICKAGVSCFRLRMAKEKPRTSMIDEKKITQALARISRIPSACDRPSRGAR